MGGSIEPSHAEHAGAEHLWAAIDSLAEKLRLVISSIPYTLSVVANDNDKTSMRMGIKVPVPQFLFKGGDAAVPVSSYSYRSVATNIDCSARTIEGGRFKLDMAVSDTAVFVTDKAGTAASTALPGVPASRSLTSSFTLLLKNGQTWQHTAATDPVSGEVLESM